MEEKKYPIVGYAPGNYQCKCCDCGESFLGDKRAVQCEPCAVATKEKFDALSPDEQKELMERNAEAIREVFSIGGKKCNCNEPYDSEKHGGGYPRCPVHDKAIDVAIIGHGTPKLKKQCGPVWVKASERFPGWRKPVMWRLDGIERKVCDVYYLMQAESPAHIGEYEWLDEAASSGERDPYAGFRETIENIIHSAGKHNQEQCTEIADAILREAAPSGEISQDAHEKEVMMNAFNEVRRIFEGRVWIMDGRGSYPYNDDRYREEVRHMYNEFDELHKNTWANIKSHSSEYRQAIIEQYLKEKEEAAPSGERESDAVAFNIYCTDSYYYENGFWWHKENHDPYSVDQLYDIFKQQKEG